MVSVWENVGRLWESEIMRVCGVCMGEWMYGIVRV